MRTLALIAVAGLALGASSAFADISVEAVNPANDAGLLNYNYSTGVQTQSGLSPAGSGTIVYDNTTSSVGGTAVANSGLSATDTTATYGGECDTVGAGGTLTSMYSSIYNTSTSGGTIKSFTENVAIYDLTTSTLLGSAFSVSYSFASPYLPKGYFSQLSITGLDSLGIVLSANESVVVLTSFTNVVLSSGTASKTYLSVVSAIPPAVGAAPGTVYISDGTKTAAGFYSVGSPAITFDPIFQLAVAPAPASAGLLGLAGLAAARRRRA